MLSRFRQLSLAAQMSWAVAILLILTTGLMTWFLTYQAREGMERESAQALERQGKVISELLAFYHRDSLNNAQRLSEIFFDMFPQGVRLDTSQKVAVKNYSTAALLDENGIINGDFTKPDQFTRMTGGTATVFSRHGDDFLRVSTSLKKENGSRAFGTLLGTSHPGYRMLINGETYTGVAHLFGRDYMTVYRPVQRGGQTIAILYIGFDLTRGLASLRNTLTQLRIGDSGQVEIMAGRGHKRQGQLLMSASREGENLQSFTTLDGQRPLEQAQRTLQTTQRFKQGGTDYLLSSYRVDGWNWTLLQSAPMIEFMTVSSSLRNTMMALVAATVLVCLVAISLLLKRMLFPLRSLNHSLREIGEGRLDAPLSSVMREPDSQNEIVHLGHGVMLMQQSLRQLVAQLQHSTSALNESAHQVQGAGRASCDAVQLQGAEVDMVASAMEEMVTTTQVVANDAVGAAEQTRVGTRNADCSREAVETIRGQIGELAVQMENAARLVGEVELESENIGNFVETISEVADQTNLLALNAAIEAARAGETGRGFAVVADEVRALAGRTQQATGEIGSIVARLQDNIHKAVEVIHQGEKMSEQSVNQAAEMTGMLSEVLDSIGMISQVSDSIASAAEQQAATAETVNQSLHKMQDLSSDTLTQSENSLRASDALVGVSEGIAS